MSDTSEVNIPLLRKAVEWAETEAALGGRDGAWDQSFYVVEGSCGTAYCIAGWTLHQAGYSDKQILNSAPSHTAAELLGIKPWAGEDGHLFDGKNSIEDVRRIAESLAGERL